MIRAANTQNGTEPWCPSEKKGGNAIYRVAEAIGNTFRLTASQKRHTFTLVKTHPVDSLLIFSCTLQTLPLLGALCERRLAAPAAVLAAKFREFRYAARNLLKRAHLYQRGVASKHPGQCFVVSKP